MIDTLQPQARDLGLAAIGIAPATDEVARAFGWARSVVCVALSYLPPHFDTVAGADLLSASGVDNDAHQDLSARGVEDGLPRGLVARFARSSDYHVVMREKLAGLAEVVRQEHPEARLEICVDTCPLPERKLAVLAGIAWPGKNGNMFVEGCGSWVVLGEIITNLPMQSGVEPPQSKCGDCARCIDACPTGAITAAGEVDCARCISALTQASGAVDPELRRAMGNRIYGCDICQQVCPQNEGVVPVTPEFANDLFPGACPGLIPLIRLDAADFKETVAPSSIGWIRRTRIRRNAAIAAGNLKCEAAIPALTEMLSDDNPVLRNAAEWAIKEIAEGLSKKP
jgi:epoxyqueuosine reductase